MADGSSLAFFDLGDDVAAAPSPNTPQWCNHMALQVGSVEELDRAHKRLVEAGVEVVGPLHHDGYVKSIYFADPNGARLELTTPTASAETLAGYREKARRELDAWTREKRAKQRKAAAA
jgi:catechol-2,3-dioxygenase